MAMIELQGWDELAKQLDRVDNGLTGATHDCVAEAGAIVEAEAKRRAPSSANSGNARRWSKKTKGLKSARPTLRDSITTVVRNYKGRSLAIVGCDNAVLDHLRVDPHAIEDGHEEILWGKPTGRRVEGQAFLRPAFDETQSAQHAAMANVVTRKLRELNTEH